MNKDSGLIPGTVQYIFGVLRYIMLLILIKHSLFVGQSYFKRLITSGRGCKYQSKKAKDISWFLLGE